MVKEYTDEEKAKIKEKALKDHGYYDENHIWNSIITFPGDNHIYRHRVETLIFKNGKEIFVKKKTNGSYVLPGGSVEKDIPNDKQAENECREEARMKIKNITNTKITYKEIKENPHPWVLKQPVVWTGYYTEIYVADYDGKDTSPVEDLDKDPLVASGRWYTIRECYKFFSKEHHEAVQFYLNKVKEMKESENTNDLLTESYVSNYFKNKKFLKQISKNREIDTNTINQVLDNIDKSYLKLKEKSSIKREAKLADAQYRFYPVITLDFPDQSTITIALNFTDQFSPGSATHTDTYGDLVILQPNYFKQTKEQKKFTLLHEIGHLRLSHLQQENLHKKYFLGLFGDVDIDEYRGKLAQKADTMYPEINADLYAVLNGAKMYAVLDVYDKDVDDKYDYRVTNAELANRYVNVYKKYRKLLGKKVLEATSVYELTDYDLYILKLHDFIYENSNFDDITDIDKEILYKLLYEYTVTNSIKEFKNYDIITPEYIREASEDELIEFLANEKKARDKFLFNSNHIIESEDNVTDKINTINNFIYEKVNEIITTYYEKKSDKITLEKDGKKGIIPPKKCDKCGGDTGIFIKGEPVCLCKKCGKYFGTVEFKESDNSLLYGCITMLEAATKRKNLPDSVFGTSDRKFPLDTKKHVYSAIKLFSHYHGNEKKELAKKILAAMKKYDIPMSAIGPNNPLRNYI